MPLQWQFVVFDHRTTEKGNHIQLYYVTLAITTFCDQHYEERVSIDTWEPRSPTIVS